MCSPLCETGRVRLAYKVRAYPNVEQRQVLARTFGCVRLVWNKALADRQRRFATEGASTTYRQASENLTGWKSSEDLTFLNEVSSVPLQQVLRHQQVAFNNYFAGRARYPRFKSRKGRQSAEYTRSAFRMRDGQLWLAKTTMPLILVWSWPNVDLAGLNPTTVTVSRDPDDRWYVSFAVDTDEPAPLAPTGNAVGVDVGIKDFAVLSTGEKIANPAYLSAAQRKLVRAQRSLARKQKGSSNRAKARLKVARAHSKVSRSRRDFHHKLSTRLVRDNDLIAVEDLAVTNMVKNRHLARSISDAGWSQFRQFLDYKAQRAGRRMVQITRWYPSSKTCSVCGYLLAQLSLGTRQWTCPSCGTRHDRDINAAQSILLAAGLAET